MIPKVSVVMSCYNSAKTVRDALRSIQDQTLRDIEIILINDGSTDDTLDILSDMVERDDRLRIIDNGENIGLSASLNRGIRAASSSLIARMDADDWSLPERLETQYDFLQKNKDIDICGSGMSLYRGDQHIRDVYLPEQHADIIARAFTKPMLYHPTIMIRRSVYEDHGCYDPTLRWAEDADLWYRIYDQVRMYNLQCPLVRYQHKPRLTTRILRKNLQVKYTNLQRRGLVLRHLPTLLRDALVMTAKIIRNG